MAAGDLTNIRPYSEQWGLARLTRNINYVDANSNVKSVKEMYWVDKNGRPHLIWKRDHGTASDSFALGGAVPWVWVAYTVPSTLKSNLRVDSFSMVTTVNHAYYGHGYVFLESGFCFGSTHSCSVSRLETTIDDKTLYKFTATFENPAIYLVPGNTYYFHAIDNNTAESENVCYYGNKKGPYLSYTRSGGDPTPTPSNENTAFYRLNEEMTSYQMIQKMCDAPLYALTTVRKPTDSKWSEEVRYLTRSGTQNRYIDVGWNEIERGYYEPIFPDGYVPQQGDIFPQPYNCYFPSRAASSSVWWNGGPTAFIYYDGTSYRQTTLWEMTNNQFASGLLSGQSSPDTNFVQATVTDSHNDKQFYLEISGEPVFGDKIL